MKNLSLFVTLSLLTLMGTCTIVKANPAEDNLEQYQNSVILSQAEEMPGEDTGEDTGEMPGEDTGEDTGEMSGEMPGEDTGEEN